MQITAVLLLVFSLTLSARTVSQTISFKGKNVPLKVVFEAIEDQTDYLITTNDSQLNESKAISLDVANMKLKDFLILIFKNQPLTYSIDAKTIFVQKKDENIKPSLQVVTPPITVRGRIVNENGEPVIASVTIKGTTRGEASNANGEFELKNVSDDAVLIISATNIEPIIINVNKQTNLSITAKTIATSLNEVVVNKGYYTEKKRLGTGNVARVTASDIDKQPITNPLQSLQGRVSGVYINQTTGLPGGGFDIQIRGRNSLRNTSIANLPLYVIDGVPYTSSSIDQAAYMAAPSINPVNPLVNINPADIESIEILKDADATSIYGSRGSNGVVLIATKKGQKGKTSANVDFSSGVGRVNRMVDVLNTQQYMVMRREGLKNDNVDPFVFPDFYPDVALWDTTRYTNWQKEIIGGTANITSARASLTGGSSNTQFLFSLQYYKEGTVYPGNFGFRRGSGNLSITHQSTDTRFQATFSANFNSLNNLQPGVDVTEYAVTTPPNAPPIYTTTGAINWEGGSYGNYFALLKNKYEDKSHNLIASGTLSYELLKNLKLSVRMGYNMMEIKQIQLSTIAAQFAPSFPTGSTNFGTSSLNTWIIEPQLTYEKRINKNTISGLIGSTLQDETRESETLSAGGYTRDALLENIKAAAFTNIVAADFGQYRYNAVFARINYNYDNKYLVNVLGRRDGSSKFGPNKQFGNFGAVGMAWIFTEEKFLSAFGNFLSFGKLKGSYGITGNDQIPSYGYLDAYTPTPYPYQGATGIIPSIIPNPDFSWETNKKLEGSVELGFFKDRLFFSGSYYKNRSSNQLIGYPLSIVTGGTSVQLNQPATIQNTGWEFEISSTNIKSKQFKWTSSFNISIPNSKLVEYSDLAKSSLSENYVVGKPLYVFKGYHLIGVNSATGLYEFQDTNKDGVINSLDRVPISGQHQEYYGGFQNNFSFKGIQLDFLFQFVKQTGSSFVRDFSTTPGIYNAFTGGLANQPTIVMERWQKPGDQSFIQRFAGAPFGSQAEENRDLWQASELFYADASFIRLKNVSISYNLSKTLMDKIHLKGIQLYVHGQNIWTKTDYTGDPETQQHLRLPVLKIITIGIKATL